MWQDIWDYKGHPLSPQVEGNLFFTSIWTNHLHRFLTNAIVVNNSLIAAKLRSVVPHQAQHLPMSEMVVRLCQVCVFAGTKSALHIIVDKSPFFSGGKNDWSSFYTRQDHLFICLTCSKVPRFKALHCFYVSSFIKVQMRILVRNLDKSNFRRTKA